MTQHKYLVTVLTKDGQSATTLHFTDDDLPTKLKLIAQDLGLEIDDNGFLEDDPEIRSITIRRADDLIFKERNL